MDPQAATNQPLVSGHRSPPAPERGSAYLWSVERDHLIRQLHDLGYGVQLTKVA